MAPILINNTIAQQSIDQHCWLRRRWFCCFPFRAAHYTILEAGLQSAKLGEKMHFWWMFKLLTNWTHHGHVSVEDWGPEMLSGTQYLRSLRMYWTNLRSTRSIIQLSSTAEMMWAWASSFPSPRLTLNLSFSGLLQIPLICILGPTVPKYDAKCNLFNFVSKL